MSKNNYVDNKEILLEIKDYRESGVMSDRLAEIILTIAEKYSNRGGFFQYTWREDMVASAVLTCVKYLHNFDPDKSKNAFSYITKICERAFIAYINDQKKHSVIKDVCWKNFFIVDEDYYTYKSIDYPKLSDYVKTKRKKTEK